MSEAAEWLATEWRATANPTWMVHAVWDWGKASERKLRLFAAACCRRVWNQLSSERVRRAVEVAERYADGLAAEDERLALLESPLEANADHAVRAALAKPLDDWHSQVAASYSVRHYFAAEDAELLRRCHLLRDIFGNPFGAQPRINPTWLAWNEGTVVQLAAAAYQERQLPGGHFDAARLAVLCDALEEAGCTDTELLGHLRATGDHVPGCWVVDLLLGKT